MTGQMPGPSGRVAPREIVLALGSNLGDRLANLQAGIDALAASGGITAVGRLRGLRDQPGGRA